MCGVVRVTGEVEGRGAGQMVVCRLGIDRESEQYYEGVVGLETERVVGGVGARQCA